MEAYQELEQKWAEFTGDANMVVCSSGTAALHLSLEVLQLPHGSGVIVPDFAMIACARAVTLAGLVPIFVDVNDDLLLDHTLIDKAMTRQEAWHGDHTRPPINIRAVMAVHTYGRTCDMGRIGGLAYKYKLHVIEDAAECQGAPLGPCPSARCWSFYKNKIIAGAEGGAVAFSNPDHAGLARQLWSLGDTELHDFWHVPRGHNYRLSNVHAREVLRNWDKHDPLCPAAGESMVTWGVKERRQIEAVYDSLIPAHMRMPARQALWVYDLKVPAPCWGHDVVKKLNALGIAARHSFKPLSRQQEYRHGPGRVTGHNLSRADELSDRVLYLPIQPGVTTEEDCRRSMEVIKEHCKS